MTEHPDCKSGWKIGFGSGVNGSVNVRSGPAITFSRVEVLRSGERKIVEWNDTAIQNEYWYPVRVYTEGKPEPTTGWVHSSYASLTSILPCIQKVGNNGKQFVDYPLPGYPTMHLEEGERQRLGDLLKWLGMFVINGPHDNIDNSHGDQ